MKFKPLTLAVSGALVALSGSAFAYNFADGGYTAANTAAVYISGSSATNNQLKAWATGVFCDSTKQVSYNDVGTDTNQFAVVCQPKAAFAGSFGKTNVAIIKNSNGGSGNGISKLTGTGLQFTNVFPAAPLPAPFPAAPAAPPPTASPFPPPVPLGLPYALPSALTLVHRGAKG